MGRACRAVSRRPLRTATPLPRRSTRSAKQELVELAVASGLLMGSGGHLAPLPDRGRRRSRRSQKEQEEDDGYNWDARPLVGFNLARDCLVRHAISRD